MLEVAGAIGATQYLYSSDKTLKQNIVPLDHMLEKILRLSGYSFDWKSSGKSDIGLIAQEVELEFPTLVHTNPATGLKSVEYGNLVAPLIQALHEQQDIIERESRRSDSLQIELSLLRARLEALEAR